MQKIKDKLDKLYATIESSKRELAFNKGKLEPKLKRLKDEFEIDSVEEAEKIIKELEVERDELEERIFKLDDEIRKELENGRE